MKGEKMIGKLRTKRLAKLLTVVCIAGCVPGSVALCVPKDEEQLVVVPELCWTDWRLDAVIVAAVEARGSQTICVGPDVDLLKGTEIPGYGVVKLSEEERKSKKPMIVTIEPSEDSDWTGPHEGETRTVKITSGGVTIRIIPVDTFEEYALAPRLRA
jgi:hypothetical protein